MFVLEFLDFYQKNNLVSIIDIVLAVIYLVVLLYCAATIIGYKNGNK